MTAPFTNESPACSSVNPIGQGPRSLPRYASLRDLHAAFLAPGTAWRGKPLWAWNHELDATELRRQIGILKQMGFGGFFMHSRTGLRTPYLGDKWFNLIDRCTAEAERLGLEAWLYDEDRWPSGTAGGQVTVEPQFRQKYMELEILDDPAGFVWESHVLAAFAGQADGTTLHAYRQLLPDIRPQLQSGEKMLVVRWFCCTQESFYNNNTYLDTLNRSATERFLALTHEKYWRTCRTRGLWRGIFTDEPHRGQLMDPFVVVEKERGAWRLPYTPELFAQFRAAYGKDLQPRLPELFMLLPEEPFSALKSQFVELLQRLFIGNFAVPCLEWCREHGLLLCGHVLHEDSLAAQTAMIGSVMRYYPYMDYPGVDVLCEGNRNYWIVKQLSSVARQLGQPWLISELYGCTGWQMTFLDHKWVGDWQTLFGINLRCHHLCWYTMAGEAKRDYPASIFFQSAWWPYYDRVETYFARLGLMLSQGQPCCDILLIHPIESMWAQVHPGWSNLLSAQTKPLRDLETQFADLFHWLTGAQIDFDYGDEHLLANLGLVEQSGSAPPMLHVGQSAYRAIIVPPVVTLRGTTVALLQRFQAAGGTVLFLGAPATLVDSLPSPLLTDLAQQAIRCVATQVDLVAQCEASGLRRIEIVNAEDQTPLPHIFAQFRADDDRRILMLLNMDREHAMTRACIRIRLESPASWVVESWDPICGTRDALSCSSPADYLEFELAFAPAEGHLLLLHQQPDWAAPPSRHFITHRTHTLSGPFGFSLGEPNVVVLDHAAWRLGEKDWQPAADILRIDQAVRDRIGLPRRSGMMIQPWAQPTRDAASTFPLELTFQFCMDTPISEIELVLEQPDRYRIFVNACPIDNEPQGWWIDPAFRRLPLPSHLLRPGENTLSLRCEFDATLDLEAIYLLGSFGVRVFGDIARLVPLPAMLASSPLDQQCLPFYSGSIRLKLGRLPLPNPGERAILCLDRLDAACARLLVDDHEVGFLMWPPLETDVTDWILQGRELRLELILTRRNTFGPLHLLPAKHPFYGPDQFISSGENYSESFIFWSNGLLCQPRLEYRIECDPMAHVEPAPSSASA